jgi:hypothetical protein
VNGPIQVDPIVWLGILGLLAILLGTVAYLLKSERKGISRDISEARQETHNNHIELRRKVERVESDVGEIRAQMGSFVTREENNRSFSNFFQEQRTERAELRGFLTGWLERIERTLERKADKA